MTKEFGSKLAGSVRQAKAKQPQKNTSTVPPVVSKPSKPELPLPVFPSRRVWPD